MWWWVVMFLLFVKLFGILVLVVLVWYVGVWVCDWLVVVLVEVFCWFWSLDFGLVIMVLWGCWRIGLICWIWIVGLVVVWFWWLFLDWLWVWGSCIFLFVVYDIWVNSVLFDVWVIMVVWFGVCYVVLWVMVLREWDWLGEGFFFLLEDFRKRIVVVIGVLVVGFMWWFWKC